MQTNNKITDFDVLLGQRIGIQRDRCGLSQDALGAKVGVSREIIQHWERGSRKIKPDRLAKLSDALGVSADYLLGITKAPTRDMAESAVSEYTGLTVENIRAFRELHPKCMAAFNAFISVFPLGVLTQDLFSLYSAERVDAFLAACYNAVSIPGDRPDSPEMALDQLQIAAKIFRSVREKLLSSNHIGFSKKEQAIAHYYFDNAHKDIDSISLLALEDIDIIIHDYFKHQIQDTLSDMLNRFIEDARMTMHTKEITSLIEATVSECADKILKEAAHGET